MTSLFVREWPGNSQRPAIALHCMMANASYWGPISVGVKDLVQISAPDLPGHGQSPDWPGQPDLHTHITREVASLITRPVDLIGHSLGATVALRIAVGAPEAVRSLTLIEPVLFAATPATRNHAQMIQIRNLAVDGHKERAAQQFVAAWGGLDWDQQTPMGRERLTRQVDLVVAGNDALMCDSGNILREGGLEAIDAPVMIIMGEDTPPAIPAIADALAARLPDVARASVPRAGHMLPITHPTQVMQLLRMNLERS